MNNNIKGLKSVLVIDTPICCKDCIMCFERHKELRYAKHICNYEINGYKRYIPDILEKPDWCPLPLLPEPKDLTKYTTGPSNLENVFKYAHDQGYNDCLYQLNGGI